LSTREPGTILDSKYEIVERLKSGGMGEVYLVRHVHLQELRVVKILRQDMASDTLAQKRFVREARLATQIKNPNVAILYDFSRLEDGSFYMVWEYIEGQDVGERIRQQGHFSLHLALSLGIQGLRGLEAIHVAGIVHRDVSPDNLMIMENLRGQPWVKIIDLGLARHLDVDPGSEITQVGMFMGKLRYCSPEQAAAAGGEGIDRRSDLYSFALVLYEMVTGLPPFESDSQPGFIFKRLSEDPLPMTGRNPSVAVPAELDRVMRRALERDRDKRFPDAVAFLEALERVQTSLLALETREVVIPPLSRRAERPPAPPVQTLPPPPPPAGTAVPRGTGELTREERLDLLAQIDRAARRMQEGGAELARADEAISAGRLDEARALLAHLEVSSPRLLGLAPLRQRLTDLEALAKEREAIATKLAASAEGALAAGRLAEARSFADQLEFTSPGLPELAHLQEKLGSAEKEADLTRRIAEAEQVLNTYLQKKQLALAKFALETLLELSPEHPNRSDYKNWVSLLSEEVEQDRRADVALATGRSAVARGDFAGARRELEVLARNDLSGSRAEQLLALLEAAERERQQGADFEQHKGRLEELLAARRVPEAEKEIEQLAALGIARVSLDFYRERLQEVRAALALDEQVVPFEQRYRDALHAHDWFAAREVAIELDREVPASRRSAAMYAEVERLETIERRQKAIDQGVQQVDALLAQGNRPMAEVAFKILLQMDPDNRHRKRLEKQLRG
jgi:serine/threonine protein kinase